MNERITELIIEANNYATEKHPIPDDADSMTKELIIGNRFGESQRKLAELIVREYSYDCMDVTSNSDHIQFVAKKWGVEL